MSLFCFHTIYITELLLAAYTKIYVHVHLYTVYVCATMRCVLPGTAEQSAEIPTTMEPHCLNCLIAILRYVIQVQTCCKI